MISNWNGSIHNGRGGVHSRTTLLGAALLSVCFALPASAETFDVMNLGLGGRYGTGVWNINEKGQAIGYSSTPSGAYHAFFASRKDGNIDIGTLGEPYSEAKAINASGQVIGDSCTDIGNQYTCRAFSWTQSGGIVNLGTLGGGWSTAIALNDSGKVIGVSETADGGYHGFSWTQAGGIVDLGTLGGSWAEAWAINALGQVVGYSYNADNTRHHAVLWQPDGSIVDLGSLGGDFSLGLLINDSGQVVGDSYWVSNGNIIDEHPFFWTPAGGMVDIGTLGGRYAWPYAVNASGQVVGLSDTNGYAGQRAFTWTQSDGLVDLNLGGGVSEAFRLSASGHVVGSSQTATDLHAHAFQWSRAGGMMNLGTFGGTTSVAYGVNKWGQAVGYASLTGDATNHAFLYDSGMLQDLNNLVANKPADMELQQAFRVTDDKSIVAWTSAGPVLLSPSSTVAAPPVIGAISANDPIAVGTSLSASASFTDAAADTHNATWSWGDGTPSQPGTVSESNGSGTTSASHAYAEAGVYPVTVAVTDNTGKTSQVSRNVVVYDPAAGFVTGSGWIQSPAGAYKADPNAIGRATFAFVSKYQKGAKVPTGTTEFHFQTVQLNFASDSYDWLVVAGARAQFKGTGTINNSGSYKFILTAIDGMVPGGRGNDRFRIKIWHYDDALQQDVVDYDNQLDASTDGTLSEGTTIGGGSIVIHASTK